MGAPGRRGIISGDAVARIYATWNPLDKSANYTLSNGNLTAVKSGTVWNSVRATIGKSSGVFTYEVYLQAVTQMVTGIALLADTLGSWWLNPYKGMGYASTGWRWAFSAPAPYGASYVSGDYIGIKVDMDAKTISFYKNGVLQGVAYSGFIAGTYYPIIALFNPGIITANFGATSFQYPILGVNDGVYTT